MGAAGDGALASLRLTVIMSTDSRYARMMLAFEPGRRNAGSKEQSSASIAEKRQNITHFGARSPAPRPSPSDMERVDARRQAAHRGHGAKQSVDKLDLRRHSLAIKTNIAGSLRAWSHGRKR